MGLPNCPSDQYPTNFTCDGIVCGPPLCSVKEDCTANGQLPTNDCFLTGGVPGCAKPCMTDADCGGTAKCTGLSDNLTMLCAEEQVRFMCMSDAECNGFGVCEGGACVCHVDGDCTNYVDTCVK